MSTELTDAIRLLVQERGISEDLIQKTIEEFLIAAYKKRFGTVDNAVVKFNEEDGGVVLYAQKEIVEDVYDPVSEISLEEALRYDDDCEIGDELLIEIDPREFDRVAVQSAKQKAKQTLREIQKDTLYSEFQDKVGEMVIGYYQRERNGNIFVDLGKTEGLLPKRYQSPREVYRPNDRIKALIYEVTKTQTGLQIILSRTHTDFVKRIFELEVPEVYDKTVDIFKIVREPGYRTKLAVYSNREDVDPVGACVGLRGVRIQSIVRELEGEKIDILKYDNDPRTFIKNALSPAEVSHVIILDEAKRQALAVVPETQLSLAIGKQGLNVRLANRLVDWNIDVKTEAQFQEMDIAAETKRAVSALFGEYEQEEEEEITRVAELPGISDDLVVALKGNGIDLIEDLISLDDEQLDNLTGLTDEDVAELRKIIAENVEIIEDEGTSESAQEQEATAEAASGAEAEESAESVEAPVAGSGSEQTPQFQQAVTAGGTDEEEEEEYNEEISDISELPNISNDLVQKLKDHGVDDLVELLNMDREQLNALSGLSNEDVETILKIIEESVEIVEQEEESDEDEA